MTFEFTKPEQQAIKAAWGTEHGRAALTVVIERLGLLGTVPFNPDPHVNAFNLGRLFVGQAVREAINNPLREDHGTAGIDSKHAIPTATERAVHDAAERAAGRNPRPGASRRAKR